MWVKIRLEVTYKTPKKTEAFFRSEEMTIGQALLITEDLEKTGRAKSITFIDAYDTTWKRKDLQKYLDDLETEPHEITVYFDGGYEIKERKAGLGCVIYYTQSGKAMRLRLNALVDELETNNEAEYAALHLAIQELDFMGVHHIPVRFVGDSQVVINQLNEEWPTMEEALNDWADRIDDKLKRMGITPSFEVISRKDNGEADRLASQALKGVKVTSRAELE